MIKHPHLSAKLSLLYALRINPAVKSHSDLAKRLGITRQQISRWIHGTDTRQGDCIPNSQIDAVSVIFRVEAHWFTYDLDSFESKLRQKVERDGAKYSVRPEKISLSLLPMTNVDIFGRDSELKLLDSAWEESTANILQVVAFGGVGKSSLINCWLSRLDKRNYRGAKNVYAWSFYWQGSTSDVKSSGDFFIEHALDWFGDKQPAEGTPWAKATRLANLIRASRTLLILDGLEPLQFPPGPKKGQVENPAVALLIRELASDNSGLCIITSRIGVADLISYQDGRVQTVDLSYLSAEAGTQMLKSMGVKGEPADFSPAIEEYAGHPLSLSLLAGFLLVVHEGRISKFREIKSLLDEQNLGTHAKNLMRVYLDWFKHTPECGLLYLIGLFDRAVTLGHLQTLCSKERIDSLTGELASFSSAEWHYAIAKLEDANLVAVDKRDTDYIIDCHPLVRHYIDDFLFSEHKDLWVKGHGLIFHHLQQIAVSSPSNMKELEPLFRAVIHGTQAGLYIEAFQLYFERIKKGQFSIFTEGSHHADQACIRAFFVKQWTEPVDELPEDAQFYLLSSAATNLIYLGNINEAIGPSYKSIGWFVQHEKWLEAAGAAAPLWSMLVAAGRLAEAIELLDNLQGSVAGTNNDVISAMALNFYAHAYHLSGEDEKARKLFEQVEGTLSQTVPNSPVPLPTISSYYCKFLVETGAPKEALQRALRTFEWRKEKAWQVAIDTTSLLASDHMVLGLAYLKLGDFDNAKFHLDRQVELFKSADEWLYLPIGLNSRALYFIEINDFPAGIDDLNEALDISIRTGAKFGRWEAMVNLAALHFKRGDYKQSSSLLQQAKTMEGMELYRFRNDELVSLEENLSLALANDDSVNPNLVPT
jgi:tetratricopeptide (TPR) repeat protein